MEQNKQYELIKKEVLPFLEKALVEGELKVEQKWGLYGLDDFIDDLKSKVVIIFKCSKCKKIKSETY